MFRIKLLIILGLFISLRALPYAPDFIVEDIQFQNGGIDVIVKNQGRDLAQAPISVLLTRPGTKFSWTRSYANSSLPFFSGSSAVITFRPSDIGASGLDLVDLVAVIDWNQSFNELDEGNNMFFKDGFSLEHPMPDLIVEDIYTLGNKIQVLVKNVGKTTAEMPQLFVKMNGNEFHRNALLDVTIPAGTSVVLTYDTLNFYMFPGLAYDFKVSLDAYDQLAESNEINNTFSKTITAPI